ncbi:MAG: hypothetical protein V1750_09745, partial [Acidobacteriota bacterium]
VEAELAEPGNATETLATLRVRYRNVTTGRPAEAEGRVQASSLAPSWNAAPRGLRLATLAVSLAEALRGVPWAAGTDLVELARRADALAAERPEDATARALATAAEVVARDSKRNRQH